MIKQFYRKYALNINLKSNENIPYTDIRYEIVHISYYRKIR